METVKPWAPGNRLLGNLPGTSQKQRPMPPQEAPIDSYSPGLLLYGDTNRDGKVTDEDIPGHSEWRWSGPGAFFLANVDDDDKDGRIDSTDRVVNGKNDEEDLAPLKIRIGPDVLQQARSVHVSQWQTNAPGINLFQRTPDGWRRVEGQLEGIAPEMDLALEASGFADKSWDGMIQLKLEVKGEQGKSLGYDLMQARVAPFLLTPNSAPTRELYVSKGHPNYENAAFRAGLAEVAARRGVKMTTHQTSNWKEMWMQDTMEVGYTQLPGRTPQHVVLGGLRNADSFGPKLLGPDRGFIQVGKPRGIANGVDDWADWMGNLEVSPPLPGYPLGRVFYGRNTDTGVTLHPDMVAFLEAQKVQKPFWIDTGFLAIKHVDEIMNFLPGKDGAPRLLIADTRSATALVPGEAGPSNKKNQARLDKILSGGSYANGQSTPGVLKELGLSESQVVRLPVSYEGGHNVWSNPINSIYLNGTAVTGQHRLPATVAKEIEARLRAAGAQDVQFVDDHRYQDNLGNVHCATNTLKQPLVKDFSQALLSPRVV